MFQWGEFVNIAKQVKLKAVVKWPASYSIANAYNYAKPIFGAST